MFNFGFTLGKRKGSGGGGGGYDPPILYYDFEDTVGTTIHPVIGSLDATIAVASKADVRNDPLWDNGNFMEHYGSDGSAQMTFTQFANDAVWSIAFWGKTDGGGDIYSGLNTDSGDMFTIKADGVLSLFGIFDTDFTLSDTDWHHYAFVYNSVGIASPDVDIYVDGVLIGTYATSPYSSTGLKAHMCGNNVANYRGIDTDHFMVFDYQLTTDDLAAIMSATAISAVPPDYTIYDPYMEYLLDDLTGITQDGPVDDTYGNNDGTILNTRGSLVTSGGISAGGKYITQDLSDGAFGVDFTLPSDSWGTISVWFKVPSVSDGTHYVVVNVNSGEIISVVNGTLTLYFGINTGVTITADTWYHLVIKRLSFGTTVSFMGCDIFINGVKEYTQTNEVNAYALDVLKAFGCNINFAGYRAADFDWCQVYDYIFYDEMVPTLYNAQKP